MEYMEFEREDREHASKILDKVESKRIRGEHVRIMSFADLYTLCPEEASLISALQALSYERMGPGAGDIPSASLIHIAEQPYTIGTSPYSIWNVFSSKEVYEAFLLLQDRVVKETNERLVIASGYRSSAYQLVIFLRNLRENAWDIDKTLSVVSLPGHSEHNQSPHHAIDVFAEHTPHDGDGDTSVLKTFSASKAFSWLQENGSSYGFTLSFPEHNTIGMIYEPWHWLYRGIPVESSSQATNESQIRVSL
jgi:hypothetical protein